jgi:hypothetical protein
MTSLLRYGGISTLAGTGSISGNILLHRRKQNAPVRKNRIDALGEVSQFQQAAGLFRTPASPVLKS